MRAIALMPSAASAGATPDDRHDFVPPMGVLVRELSRLAAFVTGLTDEQYVRSDGVMFSSGIGPHIRHCLDHVRAFLSGLEEGCIDYDLRVRGTDVESSRIAALRAIRRLERQLCTMLSQRLDRPLRLRVMMSPRGEAIDVPTSAGRELAFVVNHMTHHNAMIAAMARTMGIAPSHEFGVAPSTLAYHDTHACAR